MTFAFLVHPRADLRADMARLWSPLRVVPDRVYSHALRHLPLPPLELATVDLDGRHAGFLILVPFGARHLLAAPREGAAKINSAVDRAVELGADIVGLGALTSPVTGGGRSLSSRTDIGVTNGNAFTAAVVHQQIRDRLPRLSGTRVAVVGASGSVGTAVTKLLIRDGDLDELTIVARNANRLAAVAGGAPVTVATDLSGLRDSDLIVLLTASADTLLEPQHLRLGATVIDATQPRNTSPTLITERPDVVLLDGGVVDVPSMRLRGGDIGLPNGQSYACLAETMLLSLAGHRGHFCIGRATLDQIDVITDLAADHRDLGFVPAAPTTFGRPATGTGVRIADRSMIMKLAAAPLRPTRVLMLGGGYVTLHAYRSLVARTRAGEVDIVVVSADDCHNFHGFTGEVVGGTLPMEFTRTPLTMCCLGRVSSMASCSTSILIDGGSRCRPVTGVSNWTTTTWWSAPEVASRPMTSPGWPSSATACAAPVIWPGC